MTAHNAISNIDNYADYINRILYNVYYREGILHVTFNVKEKDDIPAIEINKFISNTLENMNEINNQYNLNAEVDNVNLKISVQSPGPIEFFGNIYNLLTDNIGGMVLIAFIFLMVIGGECKFNSKKDDSEKSLEMKTEGVIGRIIQFIKEGNKQKNTEKRLLLKEKNDRFQRSMERLKIKNEIERDNEKIDK